MVLPLGIEPSSMALQTTAMTTSAKAALGCPTSIDLVLPVSQTSMQATTLRTPLAGDDGLEPPNAGIKIRCLTNLANPQ
jgi:hypothetical protein